MLFIPNNFEYKISPQRTRRTQSFSFVLVSEIKNICVFIFFLCVLSVLCGEIYFYSYKFQIYYQNSNSF